MKCCYILTYSVLSDRSNIKYMATLLWLYIACGYFCIDAAKPAIVELDKYFLADGNFFENIWH